MSFYIGDLDEAKIKSANGMSCVKFGEGKGAAEPVDFHFSCCFVMSDSGIMA